MAQEHAVADRVTDDLERLGAGARRWMAEHVDYLDPAFPGLPVTPKAKAGLELGLMARQWGRLYPDDELLAPVTAMLHRIWTDPDAPANLSAEPAYARGFLLVFAALAPSGLVGGQHEAALAKLAPGGRFEIDRTSANGRMEARFYADLAGVEHGFEPYRDLYGASVLGSITEVLPIDVEDAYKITHDVVHATDFGTGDMGLTDAERTRALAVVEQLTDHFTRTEYWDLIAEFLTTQVCLGADPRRTRSGQAAIAELLRVQRPDGSIPARFAAQCPPADAPAVELFRKAFHTTLVTTMAAVTVLARG